MFFRLNHSEEFMYEIQGVCGCVFKRGQVHFFAEQESQQPRQAGPNSRGWDVIHTGQSIWERAVNWKTTMAAERCSSTPRHWNTCGCLCLCSRDPNISEPRPSSANSPDAQARINRDKKLGDTGWICSAKWENNKHLLDLKRCLPVRYDLDCNMAAK